MNNNPVKMLFELAGTAADVITEYKNKGGILADEEKTESRMNICADCKSFDKVSSRCGACGCFMKVKVRLMASSCPISKW